MDDFSEDSESSERMWIKVTPDQARWFCGLDEVPVPGAARQPVEQTECAACGVCSVTAIERPNKQWGGGQEGGTENPIELEDLVVIKETAVYLDPGETKTALIIEGEKNSLQREGGDDREKLNRKGH